jgi:PAS domain S-box-containing protein
MMENALTPQTAANKPVSCRDKRPWGLIIMLCCIIAGFAAGGYWFSWQQEQTLRQTYENDLRTISHLKTDQVLAWRQERLADARMNSSGMVRTLTLQWLRTPRPEILRDIRDRLQFFLENEGYHNMILADTSGHILLSLLDRNTQPEPPETSLISQALASKQTVLGDFYLCPNCRILHLNIAAPILDADRKVVAVLLLVADPERILFPLIQFWPASQTDAETQLVRKDGNNVLFLNQLRHKSQAPLQYRLPLIETQSPAVQAVLGTTGIFHGLDYRGKEVLAYLNPILETNWFLVTKIDTRQMLAESRFRNIGILVLVLMGTLIAGILARLIDISRKNTLSEALLQAERERNQTRKEIKATLYGINAGVMATGGEGLVTRMNPEAERLTGWTEKEALGQTLAEIFRIFTEDTLLPLDLPLQRVLIEGEMIGVNNPVLLRGRDGRQWPIAVSWSPIRAETGEITGAVLVFRDQTLRRKMEQEKAESVKRYSDLVESVHDFIWETGPDYRYSFANKRSFDVLGYTPEEFVGKSWMDLLSREEESQDKIDAFRQILSCHQPYSQLCRTFFRKDGSRVVLESSAIPNFDQQGRFLGYRGISRDITERRKAEEEQKNLQAQLLQSQKMDTVGRLAGGVAHDFNNMLTVICTYVEMTLNELPEQHPLYKRLFEVHQAALHSADLTRQLLAFARKQVISPRLLDLNETIAGALKMLHRLIGENIELAWKPGSNLWQVLMDATQIGQILANLAVNGRDAIVDAGHLVIATGNVVIDQSNSEPGLDLIPGNYVRMTISDDGCGMNKETLSKIFEPFFTTKDASRGTGLGLATVYGIVKQNKGVISVSSRPGLGTTFNIYLPQAEAEILAPQAAVANAYGKGTETILLVEDEAAILELGAYVLEQCGYTVLTARTPAKALTLVLECKEVIDLLIADVIMPEMNGPELARKIQFIRPETRVLFVSGYTADIITHHGVLHPDVHFLEKPFSARNLGRKVREVLDQGSS